MTKLEKLKSMIEGFDEEIDRAIAHHTRENRGGQQVSFHGDFINVSLSGLRKMKWWSKEFKELLKDG